MFYLIASLGSSFPTIFPKFNTRLRIDASPAAHKRLLLLGIRYSELPISTDSPFLNYIFRRVRLILGHAEV